RQRYQSLPHHVLAFRIRRISESDVRSCTRQCGCPHRAPQNCRSECLRTCFGVWDSIRFGLSCNRKHELQFVTAGEKYMGGLVHAPASDQRHLRWRRMNLRNFFAELKRRHVYRVAIAYGVVAWLLVQVATQVFPFFEIPNWVVRLVVMVTILGFPIALIIAW